MHILSPAIRFESTDSLIADGESSLMTVQSEMN